MARAKRGRRWDSSQSLSRPLAVPGINLPSLWNSWKEFLDPRVCLLSPQHQGTEGSFLTQLPFNGCILHASSLYLYNTDRDRSMCRYVYFFKKLRLGQSYFEKPIGDPLVKNAVFEGGK